jgi:simple sugar transport system ATP-binding protein
VLAEQGKAIILITHKLKEVMAVSETATVLRRGRVTGNVRTDETSVEDLAQLMVGRRVLTRIERSPADVGEAVLAVRELKLEGDGPRPLLDDISLEVHAGEIVGVAGVAGNGQTELVDTLVGFREADGGSITIGGQDVTERDVLARRQAGLAYIPEDRYQRGVAAEASIAENLAMGFHHDSPLVRGGLLRPSALTGWADQLAAEYDIRLSSPREAARNLSGGNLQKVVLAREFTHDARFILADQPTRGVDIAATEFIHRQLIDRRNAGDAVLLISADLDEILALSDRILVMVGGRIAADRPADAIDEYELGLLMTGQPADSPNA